jgi:hypothetical protein
VERTRPTLNDLLDGITEANLHPEIAVSPPLVAQRRAQFIDGWFTQEYERRRRTPRTIIAFTGLAGAGKSTAAAHLVKCHGFERVRFAGPLKAMLGALGCTLEQIDGSEKETPCDLLCGKTPRQAMQWLGTEFGRNMIGDDLWIRAWKAAVDRLPAGVPVVVDDLRFPNEAEAVRAVGGFIVRIDRPGAGTTSTHVSEQHRIEAAATLRNDSDSAAVFCHRDVERLFRDLSRRCSAA